MRGPVVSACSRCGADSAKSARFCRSGGADLEAPTSATPKNGGTKALPELTRSVPAAMPVEVEAFDTGSERSRLPWIIAIASIAIALPIVAFAMVTVLGQGSSTSTTTSTSTTSTTTPLPPVAPKVEMQSVVDEVLTALTRHDWQTVRAMYPYLGQESDSDLDTGYATTGQQFAVVQDDPVQAGPSAWRANYLLVSQEGTSPLSTKAYCEYWIVDVSARTVSLQTDGTGGLRKGDRLDQWQGWLTPEQLPADVDARC